MTQEHKELLIYLLNEANNDSRLHIYDDKENIYEVN